MLTNYETVARWNELYRQDDELMKEAKQAKTAAVSAFWDVRHQNAATNTHLVQSIVYRPPANIEEVRTAASFISVSLFTAAEFLAYKESCKGVYYSDPGIVGKVKVSFCEHPFIEEIQPSVFSMGYNCGLVFIPDTSLCPVCRQPKETHPLTGKAECFLHG